MSHEIWNTIPVEIFCKLGLCRLDKFCTLYLVWQIRFSKGHILFAAVRHTCHTNNRQCFPTGLNLRWCLHPHPLLQNIYRETLELRSVQWNQYWKISDWNFWRRKNTKCKIQNVVALFCVTILFFNMFRSLKCSCI